MRGQGGSVMSKERVEISAIEAARLLGVGLDYLYGLIWTGKIEGRKEGSRWRVLVSSVQSRLKDREAKNG
jgi:excisionase family DNA binding protein